MLCHVCGGGEFEFSKILWERLISEWQLAEYEVEYIDRQQGFCCKRCGSNLRSIALAKGILESYGYSGTLKDFVESSYAKDLRVLEINSAGSLTPILNRVGKHILASYPAFDMTNLAIETASYDLVVHSDTLEHVDNPTSALSECKRVLSCRGRCIFTVPLIVDRLSRSRIGLTNSYHGASDSCRSDYLVQYEFGMDIWKNVLRAGFSSVTFHCIEYPAGLSLEARK